MPINNKYYNGLEFRSEASEKKIVQKKLQNRTMEMHIKQAKMQHAQDLADCKRLSWGALQQVMTKALDTEKHQNQKKPNKKVDNAPTNVSNRTTEVHIGEKHRHNIHVQYS